MWLILAQKALPRVEHLRAIHEKFNQPEPQIAWRMFAVFILLGIAVFLIWVLGQLQRRKSRPAKPQPMSLYLRVLSKLGIPLTDRWRLWWLAKALNIDHPATLLISEKMYDSAVARYCKSRGWFLDRGRAKTRFKAIRFRLFEPEAHCQAPS